MERLIPAHVRSRPPPAGRSRRPDHTAAGRTEADSAKRVVGQRVESLPPPRLKKSQVQRSIRHIRDVGAAENPTHIAWRRKDGYMFSDDPADWIEYDKKQLAQVLGRLTRMITGTLAPHLARCPHDEWALLEPLLPVPACETKTGGHPEKWPRRHIVDAIRYIADNGAKWRALPSDYYSG